MRKTLLLVLTLASLLGCTPTTNQNPALLLPDTKIQQTPFEEIATDIKLFTLKSPILMKGVEMLYGIDDLIFGLSEDHRTIYWIKGDSVIGQLEKY